jgi:1-deoxy-D-xylulose-5-phosphate synthase
MVLMMPKDENELRHMVKTAVDYEEGPIAFRYPRMNALGVPLDEELKPIPIGTWEMVEEGEDAAIIAVGPMVQLAQEAAARLRAEGIRARVINGRFIKPMDTAMLDALADEGLPLLVVEEAAQAGGLGSAVLEYYAEHAAEMPRIKLMGIPDEFIEHGSIKEQRAEVGLTADNIVERVRTLVRRRSRSSVPARAAAE